MLGSSYREECVAAKLAHLQSRGNVAIRDKRELLSRNGRSAQSNRETEKRDGESFLGSLSNFLEQVSLFNPIRKVGDNAVHSHLAGAGNVRRFIDRVCKDLEIGVVQGLYKGSGQATEG